jgi:hypothetical protein
MLGGAETIPVPCRRWLGSDSDPRPDGTTDQFASRPDPDSEKCETTQFLDCGLQIGDRPARHLTSGLRPRPAEADCETKPIPAGPGRTGHRAWDETRTCETSKLGRLGYVGGESVYGQLARQWNVKQPNSRRVRGRGPRTGTVGVANEANLAMAGRHPKANRANKPIWPRGRGLSCEMTQFAGAVSGPAARLYKTTQFRQGRWDGGAGTRDAGQMCETNPISPAGGEGPGLSCETKPIPGQPDRHPGADYAKRSQFAATPRGTGPAGRGAKVQNKPNFGESAGQGNTQHSTILSLHHSSPMPIVRNEANFPDRLPGRRRSLILLP